MNEATLYITTVNKRRVLDGIWVHGAFHLSNECSALHQLCNGHCPSTVTTVHARWNMGPNAWKSHVFLNEKQAGHICTLCFTALQRAAERRQVAGAFEAA